MMNQKTIENAFDNYWQETWPAATRRKEALEKSAHYRQTKNAFMAGAKCADLWHRIDKLAHDYSEDQAEDNSEMMDAADKIMSMHPETIIEPDPDMEKEIDDLVDGVDID